MMLRPAADLEGTTPPHSYSTKALLPPCEEIKLATNRNRSLNGGGDRAVFNLEYLQEVQPPVSDSKSGIIQGPFDHRTHCT